MIILISFGKDTKKNCDLNYENRDFQKKSYLCNPKKD